MAQHLWMEGHATLIVGPAAIRACEVCLARQVDIGKGWTPHVSAICPGDDEDGPSTSQRLRPRPSAPSGKVLEVA
jgi:hypothetical protein